MEMESKSNEMNEITNGWREGKMEKREDQQVVT